LSWFYARHLQELGMSRAHLGEARVLDGSWRPCQTVTHVTRRLQANSVSISQVRGSDGSLLDGEDRLIDAIDDMEELVAVLDRLGASSSPRQHVHAHAPPLRQHTVPQVPDEQAVAPRGAGDADREGGSDAGDEPLDAWAKERFRTLCMDGHKGGITCVDIAGDGAVTGGRDKLVRIWDLEGPNVMQVLEGHTGNVRCVQAKHGVVVSAGEPLVRVWDAQSGQQTATLEGHSHYVSCLSLHDDTLLTGSWDRTLRIWQLPRDGSPPVCLCFEGNMSGNSCILHPLCRFGLRHAYVYDTCCIPAVLLHVLFGCALAPCARFECMPCAICGLVSVITLQLMHLDVSARYAACVAALISTCTAYLANTWHAA
jgi:hypothetical protein